MGLILDAGRFGLSIQTTGIERAPLTIRNGAHRVGDQHMIVKLRVQRPTRAMPITDPQHTLRIHDRDTGMTGSGVGDAR